jgi:hypothetical protein
MSAPVAAAAPERPEWVPLTHAAEAAGMTPYSVKTAALAGQIRTRFVPGFLPRYSLEDAIQVRGALAGT